MCWNISHKIGTIIWQHIHKNVYKIIKTLKYMFNKMNTCLILHLLPYADFKDQRANLEFTLRPFLGEKRPCPWTLPELCVERCFLFWWCTILKTDQIKDFHLSQLPPVHFHLSDPVNPLNHTGELLLIDFFTQKWEKGWLFTYIFICFSHKSTVWVIWTNFMMLLRCILFEACKLWSMFTVIACKKIAAGQRRS